MPSCKKCCAPAFVCLFVLGFNDTSTLMGHSVSFPREKEKRDRRDSRGDEREGLGKKEKQIEVTKNNNNNKKQKK